MSSEKKYHINQKTMNPNICRAKTKYSCPLRDDNDNPVEHFTDKESAQEYVENKLNSKMGNTSAIRKAMTAQKKKNVKLLSEDEQKEILLNDRALPFEYNYLDGYLGDEQPFFMDFEIDFVKNEQGESVLQQDSRILPDGVDTLSWAEEIRGNDSFDYAYDERVVDDISEILIKNGAKDPENYIVKAWEDEEKVPWASITFLKADQTRKDVENYYYSLKNATDKDGVLDYVRSKGVDTSGMRPINALKAQLDYENNGRKHSLVERSSNVTVDYIARDKIHMGAVGRYDAVEPRVPQGYANVIHGIVVYNEQQDVYYLVDGYHRTKWNDIHGLNKTKGKYIILSE